MNNSFTRHDAERLETLATNVEKWRHKSGLTVLDLLISCRFTLACKWEWEAAVDTAVTKHGEYVAYFDTGRNESDARDRKIEELEAEVARLVQVGAELANENEMMRVRSGLANCIGSDRSAA